MDKRNWEKNHPWFSHYNNARQRCLNPNNNRYKYYGKRGIKFLMIIKDFEFLWFRDKAYEMKKPSIDRIDNDGNYIINNCRFIEKSENSKKDKQGSKSHFAKLTEKEVKEIRNIYAKKNITQQKLGKKYNITHSQISNIINYKRWKD